MLATVGQITGHYQILDLASLHTFGAGVRLTAPHPKAAPFAQILVGLALLSSSSVVVLPANHVGPVPLGLRGSGGSALLQVEAGLDLMRDAPVGVRVRGGFVGADDDIGNMLRVAAGLVVHFGR